MREAAEELAGGKTPTDVLSLYSAMHQLKDSRRTQGKRYPRALLVTSIVLAKAAGETTVQAITEGIR